MKCCLYNSLVPTHCMFSVTAESSSYSRSPEALCPPLLFRPTLCPLLLLLLLLLLLDPVSSPLSHRLASKRWAHPLSNNRSRLDDVICSQSVSFCNPRRRSWALLAPRSAEMEYIERSPVSASSSQWSPVSVLIINVQRYKTQPDFFFTFCPGLNDDAMQNTVYI